MSAEHTPGPWLWKEGEDADLPSLLAGNGDVICHFGNYETYYPTCGNPPSDADMSLIAAAPDLLAALQDILDDWYGLDGSNYRKAEAAICKALGEES